LKESTRILKDIIEEKNRLLQFSANELRFREIIEEKNRETIAMSELLKCKVKSLKVECVCLHAIFKESLCRMNACSSQNQENLLQIEIES